MIDTHFDDALKSGQLEVRSVDFDKPENKHFLTVTGIVFIGLGTYESLRSIFGVI